MNKQELTAKLTGLDVDGKAVTLDVGHGISIEVKLKSDDDYYTGHLGEFDNEPQGVSYDRWTGDVYSGDEDKLPSGKYYNVEWYLEVNDEGKGWEHTGIYLGSGDLERDDYDAVYECDDVQYVEGFVKGRLEYAGIMLFVSDALADSRLKALHKKVMGEFDKFCQTHDKYGRGIIGNIGRDRECGRDDLRYFNFEGADDLKSCQFDFALATPWRYASHVAYVAIVATVFYGGERVARENHWGIEYFCDEWVGGMEVDNSYVWEAAAECVQKALASVERLDKAAAAAAMVVIE